MKNERSAQLFAAALGSIPGGVNSPVRAWKSVGGNPRFVASAKGCMIRDVDGNAYIDYIGSWGPMILGHGHPRVVSALRAALEFGTSFGAPTEAEVNLAERICHLFASIDSVRLVNSGTEATMSALRAARGFTGRSEIVKFAGCYHGHADPLLVRAGSGATTLGVPDSPGVPAETVALTRLATFNDLGSVRAVCSEKTAAIIVEPVAGNMGVVPPVPGFLEGLRTVCDEVGALLIFDEVMTGFRLAASGYQGLCLVVPDLTCLGKIIGGGLPVGAYGGRAAVMNGVSPAGPVYQAGTLSGNPLAVAAGIATLDELGEHPPYDRLERLTTRLQSGLVAALGNRVGCVQRVGSMITLFFGVREVACYEDALRADTSRFARFFQSMLEQGVWLPPSQFEAWFVSAAHDESIVDRTCEAAVRAVSATD